jgi:hypothetical protein
VRNNPIIYTDPSGHAICMEGTSSCFDQNTKKLLGNISGKGCTTCWSLKPKEDAESTKDDDFSISGQCGQNDYKCLIWKLIDQMSNPYTGIYPDPTRYQDSTAMHYDRFIYDAYRINGWDLDIIAGLRINNPMKYEDWQFAEVDPDYIIQRGGAGSNNGVYVYFLRELNLDPANYYNYEANYLNAMMTKYDPALEVAKDNFYNDVISHHEGDYRAAYEWLFTTKEVIGLP